MRWGLPHSHHSSPAIWHLTSQGQLTCWRRVLGPLFLLTAGTTLRLSSKRMGALGWQDCAWELGELP
jgi:uncharacterized membrane protein